MESRRLCFPEDYLEWLSAMDGQTNDMNDDRVIGLIPRTNIKSGGQYFFYSHRMLLNDLSLNFDMAAQKLKHKCSKELNGCYYDPSWIRIGTDWESAIALDMNPSKMGKVGQVIYVDYLSPDRHFLAASFQDFCPNWQLDSKRGIIFLMGNFLISKK
ncbi:MAG: SMI1/KNR4 family protein [Pirellulaceae bacterium]